MKLNRFTITIMNIVICIFATLLMTYRNVSDYYALHYIQISLVCGVIVTIFHFLGLTIHHFLQKKDSV